MKSDRKKRILAAILCMVMVLSSNISALAEGEVYADPDAVTQMETPEAVSETQPESAPQEPAAEEPPVSTEQIAPEAPAENNEPAAPETPAENSEPAAPEAPAENNEPAAPETPSGNNKPAASETPAENNEPAAPETPAENNEPAAPETPEEETPVFSEETELTKELRDASGKLVQKVTAKLPKGSFEAETSQIEMEVTYVDSSMENYIKGMMEKKLPTDNTLGDYFLYNIQFKVNGEAKESLEPITITFEKSNLEIKDTKKANVFFFDPANPEVSGDKDELVEITQRSELLESLQAAGQSTATMEEDYDLSSIEIKEENRSGKIVLEGRKSTIYGCYVEKEPEQKEEVPEEKPADIPVLNYEDDKVTVSVTAEEAGIIPEGAKLKVLPITSEDTETKEQYQEVEKKIQEKVAEEEKEVAGFLAYDITFVDKDGNEMEPNGKVKVSMNYKKAELPPEVEEKKATDAEVTVLHLEEDENGEVKQVVDMGAEQKANVDTLISTEGTKVQNVEVETESFSVFTITWKYGIQEIGQIFTINVHYVDRDGNEIEVKDKPNNITLKVNQEIELKNYWKEPVNSRYSESNEIKVDSITGKDIVSLQTSSEGDIIKTYFVKYKGNGESYYSEWLQSGLGNEHNGDIYFIYERNSSSGGDTGGGNVSTLGVPEHSKRIKQNSLNDYTLSLDVTGKVGEVLPIDILLIIDKSGSMKNDERYSNVNQAIQKLKDSLKNSEVSIEMAAVTFSSKYSGDSSGRGNDKYYPEDGYEDAWLSKNWTELTKFDFSLTYDGCEGGTNWQAGVRKGEELLSLRANNGHRKYVLFLTDGAPTFRYYGKSSTITQGEGDDDTGAKNYNAAVNEWMNSPNLNSKDTTKYIIDATDTTNGSTNCSNFATAVNAGYVRGNSATSLETEFNKIAQGILKSVYKNVTIEDTLSAYADFAEGTNFTVTKKDSTGETITLVENKDYTLNVDYSNKKVTLNLLREEGDNTGKQLEDDAVYTLTFNIAPTEEAKTAYVENGGYLHTGEEDTDAPDNNTSSGRPGFHSNESAKVTYQENDNPMTSADYKHPVIQVDTGSIDIPETPNPIDGSITKTMGEPTDGKYPITLEVKTRLEETTVEEESEADVILIIDTSGSMNEGSRLTSTKEAIYSFVDNFVGQEGTTNNKHRVGIVTFNKSASIIQYSRDTYFSGNASLIREKVEELTADGGTNTDAGLTKALELAQKNTRNKYVILLTDGVPTRSYSNGNSVSGGGKWSTLSDFNEAVDSAIALKKVVEDIYTIGVLNGYTEENNAVELDVARTLLASSNTKHQHPEYTNTYKLKESYQAEGVFSDEWKHTWDKSQSYNYSSGYFEVTAKDDASTVLKDIWEQLATIINNQTSGSTGDGWTVTDKMADYTNFLQLEGMEINGYTLALSADGKTLTTQIPKENGEQETVTVASYDTNNKTITWTLNDKLADKSIKYNHGIDYTYRLTYYVNFEDTGKTEFRNTNETTYVTVTPEEKLYPPKMPFFVNLVGNKVDSKTSATLQGAEFEIYSNAEATNRIGNAEVDERGHFAFQFGQTDFELQTETPENYQKVVYLKETKAPVGYQLDTEIHAVTLKVSDVSYNNQGVASGTVTVSVAEIENSLVSIDNTNGIVLKYKNKPLLDWGIVKRSSSDKNVTLPGAEFGLYNQGDYMPSYKATSDKNGIITTWVEVNTNKEIPSRGIPNGIYTLKETKAPTGYAVNPIQWEITIDDGNVTVKAGNNSVNAIAKEELENIAGANENGAYFYFENTPVYELPSTGGTGIFVYTIGGTLLLMAAALLIYKMKREEVLKG
nr:VWA domain-containing protein [uncultured Blautia sp.]